MTDAPTITGKFACVYHATKLGMFKEWLVADEKPDAPWCWYCQEEKEADADPAGEG